MFPKNLVCNIWERFGSLEPVLIFYLKGLGGACGSHRQTCAVMIKSHEDYKDLYDSLYADVKSLPLPLWRGQDWQSLYL